MDVLQIRTLKNESFVKIGPRGHSSGVTFDEIGLGNVKQIVICYDADGINFIQMAYELKGKVSLGGRHGYTVSVGHTFQSITFASDEYLSSINGSYGVSNQQCKAAIKSLKFTTNKMTYGPFGCKQALPFFFNFDFANNLCGFHGRYSGNHLVAIGVYVKILSARPKSEFNA
ncbi:jacalin-related lectin 3-like [Zingiber officinale]|uniref:jacalin-related lectin 3-like n=1 Tax=Zingiber officinale TaxID=94328 RepID=UPI001C4DD10D|nr:jacalin-related lectin 3-like [Zingiber officinale]